MPIIIPDDLPATSILAAENIFTMTEFRAGHQDIRPLRIAIVNLMPTKKTTETQLLRLLGNSPLQTEVVLVRVESHHSKNTAAEYLDRFYVPFSEIEGQSFDGLIITGAPVETIPFTQVDYWPELQRIFAWCTHRTFSSLFICWGAQAALHHYYGIQKYMLPTKCSGLFMNRPQKNNCKLLRGFDDIFPIPHSRHTTLRKEEIEAVAELEILAESEQAGVSLVISRGGRRVFALGHSEYDADTLASEYFRDVNKGRDIRVPENYFPEDNPQKTPVVTWRSHANLLFSNWLNYYVYQEKPFGLEHIGKV